MCDVLPSAATKNVPKKRRRKSYESQTRYVRRVKGLSYQARAWLSSPPFGSTNLGLFAAEPWQDEVVGERKARKVAAEFVARARAVGADPVAVFEQMKAEGKIPEHVLPPGAYPLPNGGGFGARRRAGKNRPVVHLPGPFATAEEASRALGRELERVVLEGDGRGRCSGCCSAGAEVGVGAATG